MKVENEQTQQLANELVSRAKDIQTREIVNLKSFNELAPGDRFKAHINNIKPGEVTLKLHSGDTLTAKSLVLPEARIGDESIFFVKENAKGQMLLEMVKPEESVARGNFVREALAAAGLPAVSENMELLAALFEKGLPADAKSLKKAVFFRYADPGMTLEKALFMLKEAFPATEPAVTHLNRFLSEPGVMGKCLDQLAKAAAALPEGVDRQEIIALLLKDKPGVLAKALRHLPEPQEGDSPLSRKGGRPGGAEKLIAEALKFSIGEKPEREELEQFRQFYKALNEAAGRAAVKLADMPVKTPEYLELLNKLIEVRDNIAFMNHISQYKSYVQVPFVLNGTHQTGELFVFKNSGGKGKSPGATTALVALDTANLGRIETFIVKIGNSLSVQIRAETESVLKVVQADGPKLQEALSRRGYAVSQFSLRVMSQPFTLLNDLGSPDAANSGPKAPKRFSFDMRV